MVDPVDSAITCFYASACLRVVLHDLPCADFTADIDLPEDNFAVSGGSQQVVVGCFGDLQISEIFAEETDEIGL